MIHCALVPLDGSTTAEEVLPFVEELYGILGCEVRLLRVVSARLAELDPEAEARAERYLTEVQKRLRANGTEKVEVEVRRGEAHTAIVQEAERMRADLIALTTHGEGGPDARYLGATMDKVVRLTDRHVLVVRAGAAQPDRPPLLERVLVPVDGGEGSARLLSQLRDVLDSYTPRLHLLHVFEDDGPGAAEREQQALERMKAIAADAEGMDLRVETSVAAGAVAPAIVERAEASKASLIVMATRARAQPSRWVLGSVTERALAVARTPVLVLQSR